MATKTEIEISRDRISEARADLGAIENFREHAEKIVGFWFDVIVGWKYPQGQKRHGGRLWRKRMDEQITMELADLNTYWPTMLAQLDEIDKLHADAHIEISAAMKTIEGIVDGPLTVFELPPALTALRVARSHLQAAIYIRECGNRDGDMETEL